MKKPKTIRFHVEMTEEEDKMLRDLTKHYSFLFGIKVSRAAAIKRTFKHCYAVEGLGDDRRKSNGA